MDEAGAVRADRAGAQRTLVDFYGEIKKSEWARLVIPIGILRIPLYSSPLAFFSEESRFLFLRIFF
jgi:hypothetical protein